MWTGIWSKREYVGDRNGLFDDYWCDSMQPVICEEVNEYKPNYTQKSDTCTTNYAEIRSDYIIYSSPFGDKDAAHVEVSILIRDVAVISL